MSDISVVVYCRIYCFKMHLPYFRVFNFNDKLPFIMQVGTNGYFTFKYYIDHIPFGFDQMVDISLVAPFFTDTDVRHGIGKINYEIHTNSTSQQLFSKVDSLIYEHAETNFKTKWMLVALWDDVPQYAGDYTTNVRMHEIYILG